MPIAAYPGAKPIVKSAQFAFIQSKFFSVDGLGAISSSCFSRLGQNGGNISRLVKKGFLSKLGKSGRSYMYNITAPEAPFPITI